MIDLVRVFTENYKLLFRIVYASVGNIEDTKDILQDVFIRAHKAYRRNIPYDKILPWLIVIAKNRAKTYLNKKTNIIPIDVNSIETTYETDFLGFVIEDALNEMISIIPEEFRESLLIHLTEHIPLKRIANENGKSYSRLRYWRNILLQSIRPYLK